MGFPERWFSTQVGPVVKTEVDGYVTVHEAFEGICHAIQTATAPEHFVFLAGWDVDITFGLVFNDAQTSLKTLLSRAEAPIKRCLYDYDATPKSDRLDRNWKAVEFFWSLPNGAGFLDLQWLPAGSNHQKIVVVGGKEGLYAFIGGVDLHPFRFNWTDVHVRLCGGAAEQVFDTFNQRWLSNVESYGKVFDNDLVRRIVKLAGGALNSHRVSSIPKIPPNPGPRKKSAQLVQVGRTYGSHSSLPNVLNELKVAVGMSRNFALKGEFGPFTMITHAIRNTQRRIYVEDQYFYASMMRQGSINSELNKLLTGNPKFDMIVMIPPSDEINFETQQAWDRRKKTMESIIRGKGARMGANCDGFFVYTYANPTSKPPYIHSKAWIFDDDFAIIGSANFGRRSLSYDAEIVVAIAGNGDDGKPFAETLRARMWQRHFMKILPNEKLPSVDVFRDWSKFMTLLSMDVVDVYDATAGTDPPANPIPIPQADVTIGGVKVHFGGGTLTLDKDTLWNVLYDPDGSP